MRVRIAAVQFPLRPLRHFDDFAAMVRTYATVAKDYDAQITLFPEFVTGVLLSVPGGGAIDGPEGWDRWTNPYRDLFRELAIETGMYIAGGTHPLHQGDRWYNMAHLFTPGGAIYTQPKLHLTPFEADPWNLAPGDSLQVFDTPVGKLAILVCYDIEFPEAVRAAVRAGADIILCPAATDDPAGYWRVRYCCHARTVENQVYVVLAPLVGELTNVRGLEQGYGRAAVLAPCDIPFTHTGVLAEAEVGHGMTIIAEVDLSLLGRVRSMGSVTPVRDLRPHYPVVPVSLRQATAGD